MVIDSWWLFVNGLPVELERLFLFLLISCRSEEASPSPGLGCGQNERHSQPISHYGGRSGCTVLMSVVYLHVVDTIEEHDGSMLK